MMNSIPIETSPQQNHAVHVELNIARLWREKGKLERAIAGYEKVLAAQPSHRAAFLELSALLQERQDWNQAIALYRQAIDRDPNDAELHKQHINLMIQSSSIDRAFEYYELQRKELKEIEIHSSDLICCTVVRNELLRLPYFLKHHRQQGVTHFFFVDNCSTDETLTYLLDQPDVYLWQSEKSYKEANFGTAWLELLLRKYGIDCWCLIVDADELFYYPDCDRITIPQLCQQLDEKQYTVYGVILLDMYSDRAIRDTHYTNGQSFLEVCPYFDRTFYHRKYQNASPYQNQTIYIGGVRERIFGKTGDYYLTKVPLFKYTEECVLGGGQHWTNYPVHEIAKERGVLLHFKFFSSFLNYVRQEVIRQEHCGGAMQYCQYSRRIAKKPDLTLYSEQHSIKFESVEQLLQLGIMRVEQPGESLEIEFPQIAPINCDRPRPFWSTMITCHRPTYLAQTLKSLMMQAPDPTEMQIEVVVDGVAASTQAEIIEIVRRVGGDRVTIYRSSEKLGQPFIFNLAIQRAQGHWVHILHDDDWIEPGFYQALQKGIETAPEVGAAFCRHRGIADACQRWVSPLELQAGGVLENWLEKIAVSNRLQFSAIVVKRQVYETMGGFCPQADTIADWEMWKRIATSYPIWFEPQVLMNYREHPDSVTAEVIVSGKQMVDIRKTIEISRRYLPRWQTSALSQLALEHYALYGIDLAEKQLQLQNWEAAIANLKEAVKCSQSEQVQQAVARIFLETEDE